MRTNRIKLGVLTAVGMLCITTPAALATGEEVISQPNGDYDLEVRAASISDKDGDQNRDTAARPDRLAGRYTLCARFFEGSEQRPVDLVVTVDGPGTVVDRQFTDVADLATFSCVDGFVEDKIKNKWPAGTWTVTVQADNGRDTAAASGSVTVN